MEEEASNVGDDPKVQLYKARHSHGGIAILLPDRMEIKQQLCIYQGGGEEYGEEPNNRSSAKVKSRATLVVRRMIMVITSTVLYMQIRRADLQHDIHLEASQAGILSVFHSYGRSQGPMQTGKRIPCIHISLNPTQGYR